MTQTIDRTRTASVVRAEAPLTLTEEPPRVLGWLDQLGLWGNLGVSLLGPVGAIGVLEPAGFRPLSFVAAALAVVVGTVLGTALVAAAAVPGAQTGAPSMVLLRGLFGRRGSYLPTAVNVVQLVGWAVFEIVVIASAAEQLLPWHGHRWPYVVVAGVLTTVMALRPLGAVRVLRRYAIVAVAVASIYLYVELARHPMSSLTHGSWSGFWPAADVAIAVAVSWAPLASDYSRHSRSPRAAFGGAMVGYTVTQVAYYVLGLLALATVVRASSANLQHDMFAAFIAVPVGWLAFGVLVARELDQSFADTYSTVVSLQNRWPRADRRALALVVCGAATGLALVLDISNYFDFLYLLGSVFVPLTAVFLTDYFLGRGRLRWDTTDTARARWVMVVPWALGFAAYQLVYPGGIGWWVSAWHWLAARLHLTPATWMSASVTSFVVAVAFTLPIAAVDRRSARPGRVS
jgi:putative hydroxymethylpyrimidine transporter CytX